MHRVLALILVAAAIPGQPLSLSVSQERDALLLDFELLEALPDPIITGLPSGAVVKLSYPIQLRSERKFFWDRRVWKGQLMVSAVFDPVTGRYRCESILDDVIVASEEFTNIDEAQSWLTDPPTVRLAMHDSDRWRKLVIRIRVVFSRSTTWLVFPSSEGSDWVEVRLDDQAPDSDSD